MKQYGCQRCMEKKEEEKWYPLEKEDKYYFEEEEEKMYFEEKFEYEQKRPEKGCRCQDKDREDKKMYFEEKFEYEQKRPEKGCGCQGKGKEEKCKVVVEPTVYCKEEKNFRHCVKHIVPVVCKEIENHHYDHEYVIEKKVIKEQNRYDHGRRNEDWCKLAGCGRARKDDYDCEK